MKTKNKPVSKEKDDICSRGLFKFPSSTVSLHFGFGYGNYSNTVKKSWVLQENLFE